MGALLTKAEVARVVGRSERWVEMQRGVLKPAEGPAGRNGKPVPLYDPRDFPPQFQRLWAAAPKQKVVEMVPAIGSGQLALTLSEPVGPNLSVEDRAEAEKRFGVIEPLIDEPKYGLLHAQFPRSAALMEYLSKTHGVPVRTIYHWLAQWRKGGLPELVRKDRSDKGRSRAMNDAAKALLLKLATPQKGMYGALSIREMWRVYEEERVWRDGHVARPMGAFEREKYARYLDAQDRLLRAAQLPEISYETFRVWFNRIPEMIRTMGRDGGEAYRNTQEIISHRDIAAVKPMDYVVMDHRRLDIFCLVRARGGDWTLVRPWLTAAIDMRSRKWLAWAIVETPSSDSIATVLKRVFLNFGLPSSLYWDNGKDFTCEWFEGRSRKSRQADRVKELDPTWRGVLGTLGIRVHHAIVRNARAKLIEPNFGRVGDFDMQLPEWCGHKPGARPERFDELLRAHEAWLLDPAAPRPFRTMEEVAALYSAALHVLNERPMERCDGMRKVTPDGYGWMAPNEAWDATIGGVTRRSVPADVLHLCFAKRVELKVQHGEIVMTRGGQPYRYRMADNTLALQMLNGRTVQLAYDPLDLGEGAIYDEENRFRGLVTCVELRRMGEQAFVQDERDRRAARRETLRAIERMTTIAPAPSVEERLARRMETLPARVDVPRVELPAELPAGVMDQAAAVAEDREFSFEVAETAVASVAAPVEAEDEGEFRFFS